MEASRRLVEANALQLAGKLEGSCRNHSVWVLPGFSHCAFGLILTHGCRLEQQRDDAEEVDVGVVDGELYEDDPGV